MHQLNGRGRVSDDLNEHCSVNKRIVSDVRRVVFDVRRLVQECLRPFPFIWASVDNILICGPFLIILDVT